MEIMKSKDKAAAKQSTAHKTVIALNEAVRKSVELKFRNVHALIKHNRPISDISWLNELDVAKGLDHCMTYNNRKAATLFMEHIADVEKSNLVSMFTGVNFFSITMDGSTDCSSVEQESLFV
jgi:hypothetical protein